VLRSLWRWLKRLMSETWTPVSSTTETWTPVGTPVVIPPDPTVAAPVKTSDPAITGLSIVGATLTASEGTYTGSPTITRVWWVNGVATASTGLTFTAVAGTIYVVETATNAGGTLTTPTNVVTVSAPTPPVNTIQPGITGDAVVDATLTASAGVYTGSPTVTRVWLVDGVETASTGFEFTAVPGAIRVRETATNSGGTITALSNTITVAAPVEPDPYTPSLDFRDARNAEFLGAFQI
jgi:hypothetical protein